MKLYEVLNAREALVSLLDKKFTNFKVVRELASLRKKVESEVEFYIEQEKKIVQEYAQKDKEGNPIILEGGKVQLKDAESKIAFEKEITELRNTDAGDITKVTVKDKDFKEGTEVPTPNEVLDLECLVTFEEE